MTPSTEPWLQGLIAFGPIAFGAFLLIIIWKVIVKPELDSRKLEWSLLQTHLTALDGVNKQIAQNAAIQAASIASLQTLVESSRHLTKELSNLAEAKRRRARGKIDEKV